MPLIKASIRILGLVWLGLLVVIALKLTPQVQATADTKGDRGRLREVVEVVPPAPIQGAPRVVYQGPVTQGLSGARPVAAKPSLPAEPSRQEPAPVPARPTVTASVAPEATSASTDAAGRTEPAPSSSKLLDINTASAAELNRLKGAGMAGRAIVQGRPYRSTEDLLAKRVLSRAAFAQIKDQVSVR